MAESKQSLTFQASSYEFFLQQKYCVSLGMGEGKGNYWLFCPLMLALTLETIKIKAIPVVLTACLHGEHSCPAARHPWVCSGCGHECPVNKRVSKLSGQACFSFLWHPSGGNLVVTLAGACVTAASPEIASTFCFFLSSVRSSFLL